MDTVSGSSVGGYIAEEDTIGVLPATPTWHELDVETWGETGGKVNVERNKRHSASRQNSRPTISGFDYLAGWNNKMRPTNNQLSLKSFLFADYRARANSKIDFPAGDISIAVAADNIVTVTAAASTDFTEANGFVPGNWIACFSDDPLKRLAKEFFGRIKEVTDTSNIVLDRVTTPLTADAGAGIAVEMHIGKFIRNEKDIALIQENSLTLKRTLGMYNGLPQSEHVEGLVGTQFKINAPSEKPVSCELSYIAICDMKIPNDTDLTAANTVNYIPEDAYNTSSDVYQSMITIYEDGAPITDQIFGIVTTSEFTISNNLKAKKGHTRDAGKAKPGGFGVSTGSFDVDGKIDVYLSTVATDDLVKAGANVAYHLITSRKGSAYILDVPDIMNGNGLYNIPADEEVTIPLDAMASECSEGYTVGMIFFDGLPDSASPETDCN